MSNCFIFPQVLSKSEAGKHRAIFFVLLQNLEEGFNRSVTLLTSVVSGELGQPW